MINLKDKEIQYSEANLGLSENVIYSKDIKQVVLELNDLISIEEIYGYKLIDIEILKEFISKKFGDWKK